MLQFSKDYLRDRIYACWIGKNIGGTLGTPYEGKRDLLDIHGFASKEGEPLPNDDLDLQLVWLRAVNDLGPDAINSKVLGEYWISYINPNWNEYGVCKGNMRDGVLPAHERRNEQRTVAQFQRRVDPHGNLGVPVSRPAGKGHSPGL